MPTRGTALSPVGGRQTSFGPIVAPALAFAAGFVATLAVAALFGRTGWS